MLGTRSIKTTAKAYAIDLAIRMVDLTTLEGADTPGKVRALCAKGRHPEPDRPDPMPAGRRDLRLPVDGAGRGGRARRLRRPRGQRRDRVPVRTGAAGRSSSPTPAAAVAAGADEIDMVINRGAFLAGDYLDVYDEIVAVKQACRHAHLKVILETGELARTTTSGARPGSAMLAGADFIKTSTGKVQPAATLPVTLVMLEAVRDFDAATGRQIGVKPAGGIRTSKDAIKYLVMVNETCRRPLA